MFDDVREGFLNHAVDGELGTPLQWRVAVRIALNAQGDVQDGLGALDEFWDAVEVFRW